MKGTLGNIMIMLNFVEWSDEANAKLLDEVDDGIKRNKLRWTDEQARSASSKVMNRGRPNIKKAQSSLPA